MKVHSLCSYSFFHALMLLCSFQSTVLTWISLYYFSRAGPAASVRIYYEVVQNAPGGKMQNLDFGTTTTPLGISYFPKETINLPRKYVPELTYSLVSQPSIQSLIILRCWFMLNTNHLRWHKTPNLVFESEHDSGGHFASHEKPEALVGDLRKMFGKGGPVFGVVKGKNGYSA
jgi:hypothetical protein